MAVRAIIFDYFGVLAHRYGRCDEVLLEFIQQNLAGRIKLAVLSNMNGGSAKDMLGKYEDLFEVVVLSGELGFGKPDRRTYLEVARRLGEFPSDCLMVDDSPDNCRGAEDAGLMAFDYTDLASLEAYLRKYDIIAP